MYIRFYAWRLLCNSHLSEFWSTNYNFVSSKMYTKSKFPYVWGLFQEHRNNVRIMSQFSHSNLSKFLGYSKLVLIVIIFLLSLTFAPPDLMKRRNAFIINQRKHIWTYSIFGDFTCSKNWFEVYCRVFAKK